MERAAETCMVQEGSKSGKRRYPGGPGGKTEAGAIENNVNERGPWMKAANQEKQLATEAGRETVYKQRIRKGIVGQERIVIVEGWTSVKKGIVQELKIFYQTLIFDNCWAVY